MIFTNQLLVLCEQGPNMALLLDRRTRQLPTLYEQTPSTHQHPRFAITKTLLHWGLTSQPGHIIDLGLHGYLDNPSQALHQGTLIWVPHASVLNTGDLTWVSLKNLQELDDPGGSFLCKALAQFWTTMPESSRSLKSISPYPYTSIPNSNITFFGGSFNPWHRAHKACLELHPEPQHIWVIPDVNPRKDTSNRSPWELYKYLLTEVGPLGARVYPGFCGLEFANPTVRWLPFTKVQRPQILMGDDSLVTFPNWIESKTLAQAIHTIWIAPRRSQADAISKAISWLGIHAPDCKINWLNDHPYRDLSSTKIRAQKDQT